MMHELPRVLRKLVPREGWSLRKHGMYLRRHFPPDKPVRIRLRRTDFEDEGQTTERPSHYLVEINAGLPLGVQKETLWHEWAHIMAGWCERHKHTRAWGYWYAKIYRSIQQEV